VLCRDSVTSSVKLIIHFFLIKYSTQGKITALIVYVDDIIVTGNDDEEMKLETISRQQV
jgi:hypothetical protein